MQHIETVTVGSGGAASITFSAISADYTDLVIVASLRENGGATIRSGKVRFNGVTTSTYSERLLDGNGSSVGTSSAARTFFAWILQNDTNSTANTFSNVQIYIPNYRSSVYKTVSMDSVAENNASTGNQRITAGVWENNDAITSISLEGEASNFVEFSSASLYGILAGSDGIVAVS
jgi:hypothetical protein